jgi:hypothetical protein
MANLVTLTCHTCGHTWQEDLDQEQHHKKVVFRDDQQKITLEEYEFRCRQDGTYVVVKVTLKE